MPRGDDDDGADNHNNLISTQRSTSGCARSRIARPHTNASPAACQDGANTRRHQREHLVAKLRAGATNTSEPDSSTTCTDGASVDCSSWGHPLASASVRIAPASSLAKPDAGIAWLKHGRRAPSRAEQWHAIGVFPRSIYQPLHLAHRTWRAVRRGLRQP